MKRNTYRMINNLLNNGQKVLSIKKNPFKGRKIKIAYFWVLTEENNKISVEMMGRRLIRNGKRKVKLPRKSETFLNTINLHYFTHLSLNIL